MFKKISAGILSALMITAVAVSGTGCSQTQPASIDYKTADKVADGAILQAFCWDFNTIKESMGDIAAAGFSAVQTSPINECLEGEDGGMDLTATESGTITISRLISKSVIISSVLVMNLRQCAMRLISMV